MAALRIVAVGRRMPDWVAAGFNAYAKRLDGSLRLELTAVDAVSRRKGQSTTQAMALEGQRLLAAAAGARPVALTRTGTALTTPQLAGKLEEWLMAGDPIAFLIGGADGLAPECLDAAGLHWSLSPLTLPHMLVRIVLAEQLYRAHSVLRGLPYHRGE